jgi:hypothetical protein
VSLISRLESKKEERREEEPFSKELARKAWTIRHPVRNEPRASNYHTKPALNFTGKTV